MQSNNGDLYFRAGIDLDGFNAGANAMERRMNNLTSTVVNDAGKMDDAINKIGGTFTRLVSAAAAAGFVKEMSYVRAEIQSLEVSFKTLLGSEEKAMKLMGDIRKFAANTPMQMNDIASAAQTLLAFNYDAEKLIPTLKALGDVSMGDAQRFKSLSLAFAQMSSTGKLMGQDFLQMVNQGFNPLAIISEKTGKSISTLKEEMAKGKISADMVTQAFMDATSEGGKFYGMLEQQSKTVGGAISNAQGALTDMFNELGEKSEGIVYNSIVGVQKVIQNYQDIAKVLATLVTAYGAVKAANIAMNIAQKNGTGVAILDNTVWSIRAKLLKNEILADTNVTRSIRTLRKEQQAEIATLKAQLTAEQNDLVIKRSRIANINQLLTEQQRLRLANIGVTETHKDYIAIATSVLTTDQKVALAKAELTNNTTAYIAALREEAAANTPNLEAMRQGVKVAAQEAEQLTATAIAKQRKLTAAKAELAAAKAEGNQKKINIAQSKVERLTDETSVARKKALAAQRKKNTAQAELEVAARRKNVTVGKAEVLTDQAATKAKGLWAIATGKVTKAFHALKAAIMSNPIGLLITAVTSAVLVFQHFKSKADEAKEAAKEYAEHMASLKEESDDARIKLGNLTDQVVEITQRKEKAKKGTKEYKDAVSDEKTIISQLNTQYGGVFGTYNTLSEWYDTLTTKVGDYIDMLYKQSLAEDYLAQAREIRKQKDVLQAEEPSKGFWGSIGGFFEASWKGISHGFRNASHGNGDIFNLDEWGSDFGNGFANSWSEVFHDEVMEDWNAQLDELDRKEQELLNKAKALTEENAKTAKDQNINLNGGNPSTSPTELSKEEKAKLKKMQEERAKIMAEMHSREAELLEAQANTMEDSIEKRLKLIEAAYLKELGQIERDELEAKKRFKEAGMDYDNSDAGKQQQAVFEARKLSAERQREEEQKKATDGLVDYMKGKYEEYQKWVNMMGTDVANKQFANLISQGDTFKKWLDQQIANLQSKEELTTSETSYLYELMGAREEEASKFYSNLFENIKKEVDEAPDLAAKIKILQKAIYDLGQTRDKSAAKDNLQLQMSNQIVQMQIEADKAFSKKYLEFVSQRQQKMKEYEQEIKKLRDLGRDDQANALEQVMQNAIKDYDKDFIKGFLDDVFGSSQTRQGIRDAYKKLEKMRKAVATAISTGNTNSEDLASFGLAGLSLDDLQELLDRIRDVKNEVENVDTQSGLAVALRNIRDGLKENDVTKLKHGMDYITDAYSKFTQVVSALSDALNSLADATDDDNLKKTAKTVSSVSNVLNTAGSWASMGASIGGGWGALAGAIIGGGIGIFTELTNAQAEETQKVKEAAEEGVSYEAEMASTLMTISSNVASVLDTITSLDYGNFKDALKEQIEELKQFIKQNTQGNLEEGKTSWNYLKDWFLGHASQPGWDWSTLSHIGQPGLLDGLLAGMYNRGYLYNNTWEDVLGLEDQARVGQGGFGGFLNSFTSWVTGNGWQDTTFNPEEYNRLAAEMFANNVNGRIAWHNERLREMQEELERLYKENSYNALDYFNAEQRINQEEIEYLEWYIELLKMLGKDTTEIEKNLAMLRHNMSESLQKMAEGYWGADIQNVVEGWIEIIQEFGDNVEGAFAKIDESIDQMIANAILKRKVIEPMLEEMMSIFEGFEGELTESEIERLAREVGMKKEEFFEKYQDYLAALEAAGINLSSLTNENTMTGSRQNLTEETGGVIAGRMNAMVINQAEGNDILRQSLLVQYEIKNYLGTIQTDVSIIKQRMNVSAGRFNPNMNYGYTEAPIM